MTTFIEFPKWVRNSQGVKVLCQNAEEEAIVRGAPSPDSPATDPEPEPPTPRRGKRAA